MNALLARKINIILVITLLIILVFCGATIFRQEFIAENNTTSFQTNDKFVYWSDNIFFGENEPLQLDSKILGYTDGVIETEISYYYDNNRIDKSQVKLVSKGYLLNKKNQLIKFNGEVVGELTNVSQLVTINEKPYYISEGHLYDAIENTKLLYLGGVVTEYLVHNDMLYLLINFNGENGKAAFVKVNVPNTTVEDLVEVDSTTSFYQGAKNSIYLIDTATNKHFKYDYQMREIRTQSKNIYASDCLIEVEGNKVIFLQINNGQKVGESSFENHIDGISLM